MRNCHDGVADIVSAGEQGLGFEAIDQLLQANDFTLQIGVDLLAFVSQFEVGNDVAVAAN